MSFLCRWNLQKTCHYSPKINITAWALISKSKNYTPVIYRLFRPKPSNNIKDTFHNNQITTKVAECLLIEKKTTLGRECQCDYLFLAVVLKQLLLISELTFPELLELQNFTVCKLNKSRLCHIVMPSSRIQLKHASTTYGQKLLWVIKALMINRRMEKLKDYFYWNLI